MSQRQYVTQRRSAWGPTLVAGGIILVGLVLGALLLHSTGTLKLPFLSSEEPKKPTMDTTGKVAIPVSVRQIRAYERVGRSHILNPSNRQIAVVWMLPENVPDSVVRGAKEILGRVMRRDKQPGEVFHAREFYPEGTRAGPTAGVPPGKRAMRLKASEVPGLHGLRQGDRFDIVMTYEVEIEEPRTPRPSPGVRVDGPYAPLVKDTNLQPRQEPRIKRRRAEVRVVVKDGILVQPVGERREIEQKRSLLRGTTTSAKPVEETVIAVDPNEVASLNEARAIGAQLQVAMRSGQTMEDGTPGDDGEIPNIVVEVEELAPPPQAEADEKVRLIEVRTGGKAPRIIAVPAKESAKGAGEENENKEEKGEDD